jgi:predicted ATPase/DNA-binding CsgD family transcriptional regulator
VTLTGTGGTGKTRFALRVGTELLEEFGDGVFFVNLAPITDAGLVAVTVAQALSLTEAGDQLVVERLKEHLRDKKILLILDNFEQVLEAAPLVADLLSAAFHLKVLVTSRVPLHLRGEKEFPVPPLGLPPVGVRHDALRPSDQFSQYEAVRLFIERATDVKPDFQVTNENAPAIAEICSRLDGLPLAIELAAARIKFLQPQALLARLSSRLKLLTGGARDLSARQQTLRGAINWSYDLLDEGEKQLFRRLAVFMGGRTVEAAEAVCNAENDLGTEVADGLVSLVDKSLLRQNERQDAESRFVMLETIHEYAREKLEESGEAESLQKEHARYFMKLAEEAEHQMTRVKQKEWLDRLEDEHDNFRAALNWAREQAGRGDSGAAEIGLRTAGAIYRFWFVRGYFSEGRDKLQGLLSAISADGYTQPSPESKAQALIALGSLANKQADYSVARSVLEQAISIGRVGGDKKSVAKALMLLGHMSIEQGDYPVAHSRLEESLIIARELLDTRGIAYSLRSLALLSFRQGDYVVARVLAEESLTILRELGDKGSVAYLLHNLSSIVLEQGEYDTASSLYEESLAIQRELGDRSAIAICLDSLGNLFCLQKDYSTAQSFLKESLDIERELGNKWGIAMSLTNLGHSYYLLGDYFTAHSLYKESLAIQIELRDKKNIPVNLLGLGGVAVGAGQAQRGGRLIGAAQAMLESIGAALDSADRLPYEHALASARAQLGEEEYEMALREGRALSTDEAIEHALQYAPDTKVAVEKKPPAQAIRPTAKAQAPTRYPVGLTKREVQVLCLLAQGLTYEEISKKLVISSRTVDTHLTNIYNKLDVKSRSAAMLFAIEQKLCE